MIRVLVLGGVVVLIIGAILFLDSSNLRQSPTETVSESLVSVTSSTPSTSTITNQINKLTSMATENTRISRIIETNREKKIQGRELAGIAGYLNLPEGKTAITLKELIGKKIILVDFWTYSCINCQRTLPYLTAWHEKYKDKGLAIIGVHTPEFAFEKDINNVRTAAARFGVKYPVVLDNDYQTWSAYQNRYWPRKYIIDLDGYIVYDHIGEGAYEETEQVIQYLLKTSATITQIASEERVGGEISPEIYFGASRNTYLGNGEEGKAGVQMFIEPAGFKTHILYLVGQWNIGPESSKNETGVDSTSSPQAKIIYRYIAKNVFFVAQGGPPRLEGAGVIAKILRDGQPLTPEIAGEDIFFEQGNSKVKIGEARLYKLIKQSAREEHTLEIIPEAPGLEAFTFTFG